MKRLLIVGNGPTGSAISYMMRQRLSDTWKCELWDKARKPGGRMSTHKWEKESEKSSADPNCLVDLGAQYFSANPAYTKNHSYFRKLEHDGILVEMNHHCIENIPTYPAGTLHYITPKGSSSVVEYLLDNSGYLSICSQHVTSIDKSQDNKQWTVACKNEISESFDAVVLTIPVTQILQLTGDISQKCEKDTDIQSNLRSVSYSSRFALGLYFDSPVQLPFEWTIKYFNDEKCIRYISIDSKKRGFPEQKTTICVHTSVPWTLEHLNHNKDQVQTKVLDSLAEILPDLPTPSEVKFHRWLYSQVHVPYAGSPGSLNLNDDSEPLLILAGDAFVHSNLDGCLLSAHSVIDTLAKY